MKVRCASVGEVAYCKECATGRSHECSRQRFYCHEAKHHVCCNPVEEPAEVVCNRKDDCSMKGCAHESEHHSGSCCTEPCAGGSGVEGAKCEPVPEPTDLTSPLRPPRGPALYRCTKAALCGIAECNAIEDHTHNEPAFHGPRECGFLLEEVDCEKVSAPPLAQCDHAAECGRSGCITARPHDPRTCARCSAKGAVCGHGALRNTIVRCFPFFEEPAPLQGVYFSGKVVKVLSMLRGMDPAEWDKLWAMVTGKSQDGAGEWLRRNRGALADSNWAQDQMAAEKAERDGVPDSMTPAVFEQSVRAIIQEEAAEHLSSFLISTYATTRIMKLPPVRHPPAQTLPIGGTDEPSGRVSEK